ncbi:MAG: FMN-binding protein [Oligoflexia bacterium]|nr:FMN-binding protein [Oligoflexia bacterium]
MFSKVLTLVLVGFMGERSSEAKVFLSLSEALAQAFPAPQCQVKTENRYLTEAEAKQAQELSGERTPSALVVRYLATCGGKAAGRAYTDTHRVRTHPESLFVVLDASGRVRKIEVLSFDEPLEYMPRAEWYETFNQVPLGNDLQVRQKIPFVTGASLTSQATVKAARRVLALDQILSAPPQAPFKAK